MCSTPAHTFLFLLHVYRVNVSCIIGKVMGEQHQHMSLAKCQIIVCLVLR